MLTSSGGNTLVFLTHFSSVFIHLLHDLDIQLNMIPRNTNFKDLKKTFEILAFLFICIRTKKLKSCGNKSGSKENNLRSSKFLVLIL